MLFDMADLGNLDQPLSAKILSNPNHPITRHLLYLYSMESFIYSELNQASRAKDKSKLSFYGAFAASLSYIIYSANKHRHDANKVSGTTTLYRGVHLTPQEVNETFTAGSKVHLLGYTSTSTNPAVAIKFATKAQETSGGGKVSVIFCIEFRGSQGLFRMSSGYSHYADEDEILL